MSVRLPTSQTKELNATARKQNAKKIIVNVLKQEYHVDLNALAYNAVMMR